MSDEVALRLRHVHKRYGVVHAVRGIDLDVERNEFLTLLGPSGCGKTTLLRCIAGLETVDEGSIRLHTKTLNDAATRTFVKPEKRDFGMVFQSYALWPHLNVIQNVSYPLLAHKKPKTEAYARSMEVLELVGLSHLAERPVVKLSGGQQQRVALARAVVGRPEVTLFDEPLSNLDATLREALRDYIREAHVAAGGLSLYVTHDQTEALYLSDRIAVVFDGRIRQLGTPREIYVRPTDRKVADFVGFDNRLPGRVVEAGRGEARIRLDPPIRRELVAAAPVGLRPGEQVEVFVRSSHIWVTEESSDEGARNVLDATVGDVRSLQSTTEYDMNVAGSELKVRVIDGPARSSLASPAYSKGTQVQLHLSELQMVALSTELADPSGLREVIHEREESDPEKLVANARYEEPFQQT